MEPQTRSKLAEARAKKHWTLEQAAEAIGVSRNALNAWELGKAKPYPFNVERLVEVYGMTTAELGLQEETKGSITISHSRSHDEVVRASVEIFNRFMQTDLELRLQSLLYDWLYRKTSGYEDLQCGMFQEMEGNTMSEQQPQESTALSRRDTLRRLALLPVKLLGLSAFSMTRTCVPEEVLPHCASGIAACAQLAKGQSEDLSLAVTMLNAYLPTLQAIVKESSQHRQEAARLVAQALLMKATLSVHKEGVMQAAAYGLQALEYSKESRNIPLRLIILRKLAWIYSCAKQEHAALEQVNQADYLLRLALKDEIAVSPLIQSSVLGGVAKYRAQNHKDDAITPLQNAHHAFFTERTPDIDAGFIYTEYDRSTLLMDEGLTYYYAGQYDKAFASFSQVIDPYTQVPKIALSSDRIRVEVINHETLASLKLPKKDMELSIALWQTGIQGAKDLRSEQRFREALTAYDIMEALWSEERRIKELRELTEHW